MSIPDLEQIALKAGDLPSLPTISLKVMELVGDARTSSADLQRVISSDQALAARVLKIANSALFATRSEVNTISLAVVVLGFSTLRSVVMASSVRSAFGDGPRRAGGLSDTSLWEHSLATGIAARELSKQTGRGNAEESFLGGLLHDIGKLVLNKNLASAYAEVLSEVLGGETFVAAENRLFGFNHSHLGALVARKWKLPPAVATAILHHHTPGSATEHLIECSIVSLANEMIVTAGIGLEKRQEGSWEDFEAVQLLGLEAGVVREVKLRATEIFAQEKHALLG